MAYADDSTKERLLSDYENACAWLSVCNEDLHAALVDALAAEDVVNEAEAALRSYLTGAE